MSMVNAFLACGSINLGPEATAIIFSVIALWIASIFFAFINLIWIFSIFPTPSKDFRVLQICFFVVYGFFTFLLFAGWVENFYFAMIAIFGVPILVIHHFTYLLAVRRKLRKRTKHNSEP